jgi:hypothetical protein
MKTCQGIEWTDVCRQYISDFAVVIAIGSMTLTDIMMGVDTPKLRYVAFIC